jgi:gluconate 2-dehydrogenase gamma chain
MSDGSTSNSRRNFLKSGLIAISTAALPNSTPAIGAAPTTPTPAPARFLNEPERHFLESAVDRLIPPDERWPGATEAGVVNYIDLQMGGAWGKGDLIYRHGPFRKGSWTQGYQLEYTPAELFRRSITAINASFSAQGTMFSQLSPADKDAYLEKLEKGDLDLDGVPSNVFFDFLWKHTQEGFFADPIWRQQEQGGLEDGRLSGRLYGLFRACRSARHGIPQGARRNCRRRYAHAYEFHRQEGLRECLRS